MNYGNETCVRIISDENMYTKEGKELITLKEAETLGLAKADTLKARILSGKLKGVKKGKTWFVVKEDAER